MLFESLVPEAATDLVAALPHLHCNELTRHEETTATILCGYHTLPGSIGANRKVLCICQRATSARTDIRHM